MYTAAHHQGVMKVFWLYLLQGLMWAILQYSQWLNPYCPVETSNLTPSPSVWCRHAHRIHAYRTSQTEDGGLFHL